MVDSNMPRLIPFFCRRPTNIRIWYDVAIVVCSAKLIIVLEHNMYMVKDEREHLYKLTKDNSYMI